MPARLDVDEKGPVETSFDREALLGDVLGLSQRPHAGSERGAPGEGGWRRRVSHNDDRRNVPTSCM